MTQIPLSSLNTPPKPAGPKFPLEKLHSGRVRVIFIGHDEVAFSGLVQLISGSIFQFWMFKVCVDVVCMEREDWHTFEEVEAIIHGLMMSSIHFFFVLI